MSDDLFLRKNILQTIIFYDILNFPLTSFELWGHLVGEKKSSLGEVVEALESEKLKSRVEEFRGFHFLPGRRNLVVRRIQNDKNSAAKFKIAEKIVCWLRFVPFVRMVAVTGTLAMRNCEKSSDIDFFIALKEGRIFTGRLLVTGIIHLLGRRRYEKKIKNRICLNHFIANGNCEVEKQELFAANEYGYLYPLFGYTESKAFFRKNFDWMKKYKPNWEIPELSPARYFVRHSWISEAIQRMLETLINLLGGNRIESWLRLWQVKRIERNPLTHQKGAFVRANDDELVFWPVPLDVRLGGNFQEELKRMEL